MFDFLKIKNGHVKLKNKLSAEPFGCTGSVEIETDMREIVKKCHGETVKKRTLIDSMTVTLTGHVKTDILRDVYGLTNEGLKEGIYAYGDKSLPTSGTYTFECEDMDGEKIKYIAFPELSPNTGLKASLANGQDEIAEIEITFEALPDSNGYRYYEAFKDDIDGTLGLEDWHKDFSSSVVKS